MNIKPAHTSHRITLALALLLPLKAIAGASFAPAAAPAMPRPPVVSGKLDARLAVIAHAAAEQRLAPLMGAALNRELTRQNSPLQARWNAAGQVQVYLHYDRFGLPPSRTELSALGATRVVRSPALGVVQAWVPATQLNAAASLPEVARVTVPRYAYAKRAPHSGAMPRTGSVDTEGDQILGAATFRQATGYTGQGITLGVLSSGATGIAQDQSTGDLPSNVWVDPNYPGSGAEGTAMMEIIYDLAPGVKRLLFCGPNTTADFVNCLSDMANQGVNVIVDDLGFPGVALFTDGGFATAVENFAQAHPGIQLVTAAGNDATAFWAGTWNSTPVNVTVNGVHYTQAQNFGTAAAPDAQMSFGVQPGDTVSWVVEWDDPWVDSSSITKTTPNDPNDYDVVLFGANGTALACNQGINLSTTNGSCNQTNTQPLNTPGPQPLQGNQWQNTGKSAVTVYLDIFYVAGNPGPAIKVQVFSQNANKVSTSPQTPTGSIYGQSALPYPYEITVGAINAGDAFNGNYIIEPYSSRGPVQLQFPSPTSRMKPDFVSVDCVQVTGVGGFPAPFCGTSAAAPHIAGLIALLESAYPAPNPYQLLQDGAIPLGNGTPNGIYGYGLANIQDTLNKVPPPLAVSFTVPSTVTTATPVTFQGGCLANGSANGVTYSWNFGNTASPATSTATNPAVTFSSAGNIAVSLQCTNNQGTTNTVTRSVNVTAPPASNTGSSSSHGGGGSLDLFTLALLLLSAGAVTRRKAGG